MSTELKNRRKIWVNHGFNLFLMNYSSEKPIQMDLNLRHCENLEMSINYNEWVQIFYGVLNCPRYEEIAEEKSVKLTAIEYERSFKEALSEFPMLQELSDIYSKVLFLPDNIQKLRSELLKVIPIASQNEIALVALKKLKEGCEQALNKNMLLYLV